MKFHRILAVSLALLAALSQAPPLRGGERIEFADVDGLIFDNDAAELAEGVQIINGRVVLTGAAAKKPECGAGARAEAGIPASVIVLHLREALHLFFVPALPCFESPWK